MRLLFLGCFCLEQDLVCRSFVRQWTLPCARGKVPQPPPHAPPSETTTKRKMDLQSTFFSTADEPKDVSSPQTTENTPIQHKLQQIHQEIHKMQHPKPQDRKEEPLERTNDSIQQLSTGTPNHKQLDTIVCLINKQETFQFPHLDLVYQHVARQVFVNPHSEYLQFLIRCNSALDIDSVRKKVLARANIGMWAWMGQPGPWKQFPSKLDTLSTARDKLFTTYPNLQKLWDKHLKKQNVDLDGFYPRLLHLYLTLASNGPSQVLYSMTELFTDCLAQMPTRRFLKALMKEMLIVETLSKYQLDNHLDMLVKNMEHYLDFDVDEQTGKSWSEIEAKQRVYSKCALLQRLFFKSFADNQVLYDAACTNVGKLTDATSFTEILEKVDFETLQHLANVLSIRTNFITLEMTHADLVSVIVKQFAYKPNVQLSNLYPTESDLTQEVLVTPKLNLQFLSLRDYFLRNYELYRMESIYSIRQDLEDVFPRMSVSSSDTFRGWAKMALPIKGISISYVAPPKLGMHVPAKVLGEVEWDLGRVAEKFKKEWDQMVPHDVVFLVTLLPKEVGYQVVTVRGAEVVCFVQDGKPKPVGREFSGSKRTVRLSLDATQFFEDKSSIYEALNLVVRRQAGVNNFKSVLESVREMCLGNVEFPKWLEDVFLGYGDPKSASPFVVEDVHRIRTLDFGDTFLTVDHLKESFPDALFFKNGKECKSLDPPYVLSLDESAFQDAPSDATPGVLLKQMHLKLPETLCVQTYPDTQIKRNQIRFTPKQIEAIVSGTLPGLTMIHGPPGTGKTDVAVQIVSNLYRNYPSGKILLVTHSNTALNHLFEKISRLDIDAKHLVRLGHGSEELEGSWGKYGRVDAFLERRLELLKQVETIAITVGQGGDWGSTCEVAGYFWETKLNVLWQELLNLNSVEKIERQCPFQVECEGSLEQVKNNLEALYSEMQSLFLEISQLRAFEILTSGTERSNHLLTKHARIIAMTSTHASMKRTELLRLGFTYESVIMEECGQILEVESVIPLLLQKASVERCVFIGDHYQLPPIVQNDFLRKRGLEQSLFARFCRLGVPLIRLDRQARARPGLCDLYRWRYQLKDSPLVTRGEFALQNAGLAWDYQLINCEPFQGKGETEPVAHFYQNLGEAEYVVAVYQYLRFVGYPPNKIAILTTYNGQRELIRDVLKQRLSWNPKFGFPRVSTVDKFQGQQADIVLLSLVRTKHVGHLRDVRRLVVAMSRARLGLYVFCNVALFKDAPELKVVFDGFKGRGEKLELVMDEVYTQVTRSGHVKGKVINGVEEMGKIVYDMSKTAVLSDNVIESIENIEDISDLESESESGEKRALSPGSDEPPSKRLRKESSEAQSEAEESPGQSVEESIEVMEDTGEANVRQQVRELNLAKLTVNQLKEWLRKAGLSDVGLKKDLVARLEEYAE